jgi:hypothetical protein
MTHSFKIGTSASTTYLYNLTTKIPEPAWTYDDHLDEIELGNGYVRAVGWIQASWHWGYLTTAQYAQLKVFCPTKSSRIYFASKTNTGGYDDFIGTAVMPQSLDIHNGKMIDVTVNFRDVEAV